jgi:hypothetical protein
VIGVPMKKAKTAIAVLCVSLAMAALGVVIFRPPSHEIGYHLSRHIQYSFTFENTSNRPIKSAEFWACAPVAQTATQRCRGIHFSHPAQVMADATGNRILHFIFDLIPPYATKIVNIEATLLLSERPNPCPLDDPRPFLKPEPYCEVDDPAIRRLAKALEGSTPMKTAENIFRWMKGNVTHSGYSLNARGALYALRHKRGDCTEMMYLFAALCRANKIPARGVSGYLCREDGLLKPGSWHNWAEFYHRGSWWISDPQNGVFMKDPSEYIAMRIINGLENPDMPRFDRFQIRGEGLKGRMNS